MEKEYFRLKLESGRYLPMSELTASAIVRFIDYIRDDTGTPVGIEVEHDGGHGYGFNYSHERIKLYPHKKVKLVEWYTDTSEGGSDWADDSIDQGTVELIPVEEVEEKK